MCVCGTELGPSHRHCAAAYRATAEDVGIRSSHWHGRMVL